MSRKRGFFRAVEERTGLKHRIEVGSRQMMVGEVEHRRRRALHHPQRIDRGAFVAAMAIRGDQLGDAHLFAFVIVRHVCGDRLRARAQAIAADQFEVPDHRAVRNVGRDDAIDARQLFEVRPPFRRHIVRILADRFRTAIRCMQRCPPRGARSFASVPGRIPTSVSPWPLSRQARSLAGASRRVCAAMLGANDGGQPIRCPAATASCGFCRSPASD